ncbi:DUF6876 family protein [Synechococcus sp. PCC 6312]|uniref:DUF6876 family protein n=1 Tax=Synechococcus sp. (strain ATCC 27167 / PCC 6312) TaxID=195253 RepID=UPI00029F21CE|nr:DUF6876 family protein [Synechococcus sp. PCC 6312]AFY61859.1 hypothetical protein Syn6312_2779 [Synechococcus sp. PCC 6312]
MTEDEIYQSHQKRDLQIQTQLQQFQHNPQRVKYWAGGLSLTEGTQFLIQHGYHWLIDIIASWQPILKLKNKDEFQVWTLEINLDTKAGKLMATDGESTIAQQDIQHWNTSIKSITVIINNKDVLLPSEYEGLDFP